MRLKKDWWIALLLMVATWHCAQSIFFSNYAFLDLVKYESGHERMPFQGRVGMMPLLRWSHGAGPRVTHYAATLQEAEGMQHLITETYTPEKLVSYLAGLASLLLLVGACSYYGYRRSPALWWVCPALALAVFYASYAARAEQNLWYPYDLPHAALFTLACIALLEGWSPFIFLALFLLDLPFRETAIYLVPCLLAVSFVRHKQRTAVPLTAVMLAAWLVVRWRVRLAFQANGSEVGIHYHQAWHAIAEPKYWPQLMSTFGFLAIPIVLSRARLSPVQRAVLLGALPGVVISTCFGVLYETRVWCEWNGLAACLATTALVTYLKELGLSSPISESMPVTPQASPSEVPVP